MLKNNISTVIITKNEAENIEACVTSCSQVSEDIIIVDSHSTDDTLSIAENLGCKTILSEWQGYGHAKNLGAEKASHDWVLSIDADERLDDQMVQTLQKINLAKDYIYGFRRLNHIGNTAITHGEWNPDIKFRLYNRNSAKWNHAKVHEEIEGQPWIKKAILPGYIRHYSYSSTSELVDKLKHYAQLGASEMIKANRSPGFLHALKPIFRFVRGYFLKGGFLDGKLGYQIAKANADAQRQKFKFYKEQKKKLKLKT